MRRASSNRLHVAATVWLVGCADVDSDVGLQAQAIVIDDDDRRDFFEVSDPATRTTVEQASVTIMLADQARALAEGRADQLSTLSVRAGLCPDEPYGDQPSAALCSGVLLDWDLVVTAKHCVKSLPPQALTVVFGFYFASPGRLAFTPNDIYQIDEVMAASESAGDYVWLRLERAVAPPHRPAAVYTLPIEAVRGSALTILSATSGVPVKVDQGARVLASSAARPEYFQASSDTFQGSSGGGAFDAKHGLLGVLVNGGRDYVATDAGCNVARRLRTSDDAPTETYVYAHDAVSSLCASYASSLCEASCEQPCRVPTLSGAASCALAPGPGTKRVDAWLGAPLAWFALSRMRRQHAKRGR